MARDDSAAIAAIAVTQFPGGDELARILAALSPQTRVLSLASLDELTGLTERELRLVLHVDHVPLEEIGWLRRILADRPGWTFACTGSGTRGPVARALLALPRSRFLPEPLDWQDFRSLCTRPEGPLAAGPIGPEHVGALVEITGGMEQAFGTLRGGPAGTAALEPLALELRRLVHYTRTLGGLVRPPARGADSFDLVALLDEQLAALTAQGRSGGPRFQPAQSGLARSFQCFVRADRAAISVAFETLLHIARRCAGQGETVRVAYTPFSGGDLEVRIEFPAGPLAGLSSEELGAPRALLERLPELWPGELEAAGAFLSSQGVQLRVVAAQASQVAVLARFPAVEVRSAPTAPAAPTAPPVAAAMPPPASAAPAPAAPVPAPTKGKARSDEARGERAGGARAGSDDPFA